MANCGASSCRTIVMAGQLVSKASKPNCVKVVNILGRMLSGAVGAHSNKYPVRCQQEGANFTPNNERCACSNRTPGVVYSDVQAFLNQLGGDPRDTRFWLKEFQRAYVSKAPAVAVLQIDPSVFKSQDMVQSLAFALSFLQRMRMRLVVVMGIPADLVNEDGAPVSSACRTLLVKNCQDLAEALQNSSASVIPFFSSEVMLRLQESDSSFSSVVVETSLLQWSLDCGAIPLVCPVGRDTLGHSTALDSIEVTAAISRALEPLRVMFLNSWGGIRMQNQKVLSTVSTLSSSEWLCVPERRQVRAIAQLLSQLPPESSAIVTSANMLLTELFSQKGSGTMLKTGEAINRYSSLEDIDTDRLFALISNSFGKKLKKDYIDSLKDRLHTLYLSEGYSAAAIITRERVSSGALYLDKFVVSGSKQGQGTGQIFLQCIQKDLKKVFWRSRTTNKFNPWYFKHCDGSFVCGSWIIFWHGLSDILESYELVEYAKKMPSSFCASLDTEAAD